MDFFFWHQLDSFIPTKIWDSATPRFIRWQWHHLLHQEYRLWVALYHLHHPPLVHQYLSFDRKQWVSTVLTEGNQANSWRFMKLGSCFQVFWFENFLFGVGVMIKIFMIWYIKIWFKFQGCKMNHLPLATNVGSPKQVTFFSKDGSPPSCRRKSSRHQQWLRLPFHKSCRILAENQRRWRVWRCDSWVSFSPSHTYEQNSYEEP